MKNQILINKFKDNLIQMVRLNFERDKSVAPCAMLLINLDPETEERYEVPQMIIVGANFANEDQKENFATIIREMAFKLDAVMIATVAEAWVAEAQGISEQDKNKFESLRPSQMSNRKEAVIIMIETVSGNDEMWQAEILRDSNDHPQLSQFQTLNFTQTEGRLARMMPNKYLN